MNRSGDLPQDADPLTQQEVVQNFRFLAAALRGTGEIMARGRDTSLELLEVAGWTIYRASEEGWLDSIIDLEKLDPPEMLEVLQNGNPKLVRAKDSSGPLFTRDLAKTLEEFLIYLNAQHDSTQSDQSKDDANRSESGLPNLKTSPDEAARELVDEVWGYVSYSYRDQLPPDIAAKYVNNPHIDDLFFDSSASFMKAAWVCDFFADKIARQALSHSQGWITGADAEVLTGVNRGIFSRACDRVDEERLETNGEEGLARRIDLAALVKFMRKRRQREADEGGGADAIPESETCVCRNCEGEFPERPKGGCPKCGRSRFKLGKRPA